MSQATLPTVEISLQLGRRGRRFPELWGGSTMHRKRPVHKLDMGRKAS